jgi:thioredoxin-like negative regulator of GroEL
MANTTNKLGNIAFAGVIAIVGLFVLKSFFVTTAPTPGMFHEGLTLAQAVDRSSEKDGVVLAVVTADWCGPCQSYKKNGLADERVAQWIGEHGEPAYINFDLNKDLAAELGVQTFPTTLFIYNGETLGAISGAMSGDNLLTFLNRGFDQAIATAQVNAPESE